MTEIKAAKKLVEVAASEVKKTCVKAPPLQEWATMVHEKKEVPKVEIHSIESEKLKEIRSWIKDVNPNYAPFTPYGSNCGTCAWMVHNRINGAGELTAGRINIAPQDRDMEDLTGLKCKYMKPKDIENILRRRGPNSGLIIGINRHGDVGHWFNVFYDGEKFYTIDGQCGEIFDWPYDYGNISAWCAMV